MTTSVAAQNASTRKLGNLTTSHPGLLRRTRDPTGNYIASKLRLIFDDSSIFPESNYSTEIRKQRRWQSVVRSDYQPILSWREVFVRARKPQTSLPFKDPSQEPDKMFMQWKVPGRLTENYEDGPQGRASVTGDASPTRVEKIPTPSGSLYNLKPPSAMSNMQPLGSARPLSQLKPPSVNRLVTSERDASRLNTPATPFENAPRWSAAQSPPRPRKTKAQRERELFQNFENHEVPTTENQWYQEENPGRLCLPPANGPPANGMQKKPSSSVQRWIGNASDNERQVALDFVAAMSGNHDPGTLQEVVDLLRSPKDGAVASQMDEAKKTRYVRLLTPQTRNKSWMQQTWHHLPSYKPPEVNNKGAIYVVSNTTVPRHFTIHPEWGP